MIVLNEIEKRVQKTLLQVISGLPNPPTLRIAGGWVRDKLLGLSSNDIDIAIDNMNGEPFAHLVKEYMTKKGGKMSQVSKIQLNPEKSKHLETATARLYGLDIDFVNLRSETYNEESRNPTVEFGTPLQDALRRDITINALFYNLHTEKVEDFTGFGLLDMKEKRIRTPLPPLQTFLDDPLRILRVIRFASRFDYAIDPEILVAVKDPALQVAFDKKISRERVGVEITKMFKGPNPHRALQFILEFGFYGHIFSPPEGISVPNGIEKSLRLVDLLKPAMLKTPWLDYSTVSPEKVGYLYLACTLTPYNGLKFEQRGKSHSVVKYIVMNSLKLSTIESEYIYEFLTYHAKISDMVARNYQNAVDRKTIGLLIRDIGKRPIGVDWNLVVFTSQLLDVEATKDDLVYAKYAKFMEDIKSYELQTSYEWKHILDGKVVASVLGIKPGKEVGVILQSLMEWQLSRSNPTVEEATAWLIKTYKK